jgi:hypothetical protein
MTNRGRHPEPGGPHQNTGTHAVMGASASVSAAVDRRFGAAFVTPLTTREYLALSEPIVRQWPLGGWVLLDERGSIAGYHWDEIYAMPNLGWTSETTAFASFIPEHEQRRQLAAAGWTVQRDAGSALLAPYLCTTPRPWEQTP